MFTRSSNSDEQRKRAENPSQSNGVLVTESNVYISSGKRFHEAVA